MLSGLPWECSGDPLQPAPRGSIFNFSVACWMLAKHVCSRASKSWRWRLLNMERLFPAPEFSGFGPSSQDLGVAERPLLTATAARPGALRVLVRRDASRQPGVYGMIDATGRLIYVGKAKALRVRLLSYFRSKSRDPKAGRILSLTRSLVWEPCLHELAALVRELELIRRWRPHFNVR